MSDPKPAKVKILIAEDEAIRSEDLAGTLRCLTFYLAG